MAAEAAIRGARVTSEPSASGPPLSTRAPAKVNLTLHIEGRRPDGWHELTSLVAFASASDTLTLSPGPELLIGVSGPRAAGAGPPVDNLVLKAARLLRDARPGLRTGSFNLLKRLPSAAGIGGGSSDAAAALRLLARANGLAPDDAVLAEVARQVGSDVPVCLEPRARMMGGTGDVLGPALQLPPLFAVLVNPGVPVETAPVFKAIDLAPGAASGYGGHPTIPDGPSALTGLGFDGFVTLLKKGRNDMEAAACMLAPVVGDVLAVLGAAKGCRLARMSGSGATCFGLFETCRAAVRAGRAISASRPDWWVKATALR
jgi:4-diphosphocytidyl-2-C-methyl-D-erythritol kinase